MPVQLRKRSARDVSVGSSVSDEVLSHPSKKQASKGTKKPSAPPTKNSSVQAKAGGHKAKSSQAPELATDSLKKGLIQELDQFNSQVKGGVSLKPSAAWDALAVKPSLPKLPVKEIHSSVVSQINSLGAHPIKRIATTHVRTGLKVKGFSSKALKAKSVKSLGPSVRKSKASKSGASRKSKALKALGGKRDEARKKALKKQVISELKRVQNATTINPSTAAVKVTLGKQKEMVNTEIVKSAVVKEIKNLSPQGFNLKKATTKVSREPVVSPDEPSSSSHVGGQAKVAKV